MALEKIGLFRNPSLNLIGALVLAMVLLLPGVALAAEAGSGAPHLNGAELAVIWVVPFVGILLSIAIFPLVAPNFWHHNFGKISAFWGLAFLVPFTLAYGWQLALFELLHVGLLEYIPFIILLLSLFTVAGGVRVKGSLRGSPLVNTAILALGTVIASWMGTTGAAMLLIRPIIRANEWRKHRVHTIVFFIFLVANIGGSLTPLGDPPLFLGFLKGVDFFWPTTHMFLPMLMVSLILLAVYYALDSYLMKKEDMSEAPQPDSEKDEKFGLEGKVNLLLLVLSPLLAFLGVATLYDRRILTAAGKDAAAVPLRFREPFRDLLPGPARQ